MDNAFGGMDGEKGGGGGCGGSDLKVVEWWRAELKRPVAARPTNRQRGMRVPPDLAARESKERRGFSARSTWPATGWTPSELPLGNSTKVHSPNHLHLVPVALMPHLPTSHFYYEPATAWVLNVVAAHPPPHTPHPPTDPVAQKPHQSPPQAIVR